MQGARFRERPHRVIAAALVAVIGVSVGLITSAPAALAPRPVAAAAPIRPPLHTSGRSILDARGNPVHLAAVNWYGAESIDYVPGGLQAQPLDVIARKVRQLGFNAVRLQWSNQLFEANPVVPVAGPDTLAANPALKGQRALAVFDAVVKALTDQGIMVILDNHNSDAEWCCSTTDGNSLWYNSRYPEASWVNDWRGMVARYLSNALVVGADLRNEPRDPATWGGSLPALDWHGAAERGGSAVLSVNPNLLVVVEGIAYSGDLSGVAQLPVRLPVGNRVVYSPHDYAWYESNFSSYTEWYNQIYPRWGYLVTGPNPQPLVVSEYGTCNTASTCVDSASRSDNGFWFHMITTFLGNNNVSWTYWPLNGTQSSSVPSQGRTWGAPESYGVLNPGWNGPSSQDLITRLRQLQGSSSV